MDGQFILQIRGLYKSFGGVKALEDVRLDVRGGEVHGLMGENGAGKSTLMNILTGMIYPDAGEILYRGEYVEHTDVKTTRDKGIAMVHQEIMPVPELTVAQNIYLGKEMTGRFPGWINEKEISRHAVEQLARLDVEIDVSRKMKYLSVAEMQMVEIAKALSNEAKIIIMDEPTSSLSDKEVENLFRVVENQKKEGVTVIYISHRMEEIFKICDTVTVLRDGHYIDTKPVSELTTEMLIRMMVGRELATVFPDKNPKRGRPVFSVKGLTLRGKFSNVSFDISRGEVLGMAGLMGAGRTDVVRSVMGLELPDSGEIWLKGEQVDIRSPQDAIQLGISYVSEDRKGTGLIPDLSVKHNLTLASLSNHVRRGLIQPASESGSAEEMIRDLRIKTPGMNQKVKFLSGGNQQKVVIGKSLLSRPDVLILDEPTRGIDVGAKFEIYQLIDRLAREGKAILLISSELPEILGLSHRIMVLSKGKVTATIPGSEATQEMIMKHAIEN